MDGEREWYPRHGTLSHRYPGRSVSEESFGDLHPLTAYLHSDIINAGKETTTLLPGASVFGEWRPCETAFRLAKRCLQIRLNLST